MSEPSPSQPELRGTLPPALRIALPLARGSPSSLHPSEGHGSPQPRAQLHGSLSALREQLRLLAADARPARKTEAAFQPRRGPFSPVRTYVCAKDSVRHLGVSERQGEKQGYQRSCAPSSARGAPGGSRDPSARPGLAGGQGPWALPACGVAASVRQLTLPGFSL